MRTVFITGASSDIGVEVCRLYLKEGWSVIGHYNSRYSALENLEHHNFDIWQCNFTDQAQLQSLLDEKTDQLNNVDAFINLAADLTPATFDGATPEGILSAFSVNVLPGILISQKINAGMKRRNFGRIIQASSIGVKFGGSKNNYCYSLTKHAQEFIPKEWREWAKFNILVNALRIGVTNTKMHAHLVEKDMSKRVSLIPAKRLATPEEMAQSIYWFGSERNSFTSGETIAVSGGE